MKTLFAVIAAVALSVAARAAQPETLQLWEGPPPLALPNHQPEGPAPARPGGAPAVARIANVSDPTLAVYHPAAARKVGTCVVICPGGGYNIVAIEHEGTQVAEWLNSLGVTAAVLKYRVPAPKDAPGHLRPLLDAQRALALVRSRASQWAIDPGRIGVLGFSAGGNLAAWLLCEGDRHPEGYPAHADEPSCRPDFGVLIYPAYIASPKREGDRPALRPGALPGPTFFVHAGDDRVTPENSIEFFLELRRAGTPAELHVYQEGGHGFGMLRKGMPIHDWPARCADWMRARGWLDKS